MNKKGFTLIELIVVVIVIGILATFAVPQYLKAVTRGKVAKAKNSLALIAKAEEMYRNENDAFLACADSNATADMGATVDVDLNDIKNDLDWEYSTSGTTNTGFVRATGKPGRSVIATRTVTLYYNGTWAALVAALQ